MVISDAAVELGVVAAELYVLIVSIAEIAYVEIGCELGDADVLVAAALAWLFGGVTSTSAEGFVVGDRTVTNGDID